jgi:hypothetical protein
MKYYVSAFTMPDGVPVLLAADGDLTLTLTFAYVCQSKEQAEARAASIRCHYPEAEVLERP